jgi:hypothetical protein
VLFKTAAIASQYPRLNAELRRVLKELGEQLREWGLPEPVVTDASRDVHTQEQLYWRTYQDLPEPEARMKARRKFSYHLVNCAADVRVADPQKALAWLEGYCWDRRSGWELLVHNLGTGTHLHVAVIDKAARKEFETRDIA